MIRAIVQYGLIRPLESVAGRVGRGTPGHRGGYGAAPVEDLDAWYRELQAFGSRRL